MIAALILAALACMILVAAGSAATNSKPPAGTPWRWSVALAVPLGIVGGIAIGLALGVALLALLA